MGGNQWETTGQKEGKPEVFPTYLLGAQLLATASPLEVPVPPAQPPALGGALPSDPPALSHLGFLPVPGVVIQLSLTFSESCPGLNPVTELPHEPARPTLFFLFHSLSPHKYLLCAGCC